MQKNYPFEPSNTDTESDLGAIIQFLKGGKRWIISSTVICALFGTAYAFFVPPEYEAVAHIEMASVTGTPVEAPSILSEKLKLPLYYSIDTYKTCRIEEKLPSPGAFLAKQLKPAVNKNAPIVTIKYRTGSAKQAQQCLESVLADISKKQSTQAKPILDTRKSQLHSLQQKLKAAEELAALFPTKDTKFALDDNKFSASALLLATTVAKGNEIKELRTQVNDLQIALAEPQTRMTTLVTPVYSPTTEVERSRLLIILSAAIGGFFLSIALLMTRKVLSPHNGNNLVSH